MVQTYANPILTPPPFGIPTHPTTHDRRPADVLALLTLVARMQHRIGEMERERRELVADYARLDEQYRLAAQMQRDLLPAAVDFAGVEVHTLYKPVDRLSGDVYDVARLDATHLSVSLVDASGHGMAAALLSMLLKRSFRGCETHGEAGCVLAPHEVLARVNADLLAARLADCHFAAGLHAVYARDAQTLTFARGGLPYPILVRPGAGARQLVSDGPLLGALPRARFESSTVRLMPGDRVLFYTDGVEALLLERAGSRRYDHVIRTPWFAGLETATSADALGAIADLRARTDEHDWPADDLTMIALEVTA